MVAGKKRPPTTPCASAVTGMKTAPMRSAAPRRDVEMDMVFLAKGGYGETGGRATCLKRAISGEEWWTTWGVRRKARGDGHAIDAIRGGGEGMESRKRQPWRIR